MTKQDNSKKILAGMTEEEYNQEVEFLKQIPSFAASSCVPLSESTKAVMIDRATIAYKKVLDELKLDYTNDENLQDTPFRVMSMHVNELMSGRYSKPPRIEAFPADFYETNSQSVPAKIIDGYKAIDELITTIYTSLPGEEISNELFMRGIKILKHIDELMERNGIQRSSVQTLISKTVDINSLCSHHFISFVSTDDKDSKCTISYIPVQGSKTALLGISKLQRVADWFGRRPQLQEELNWQIQAFVSLILKSTDVMVSFSNIVHYCEKTRGVESHCGSTSSVVFGGRFTDPEFRKLAFELTRN